MRSEDYGWLQALTTPPLRTSCTRRLRQEGVGEAEAERALREIERALADEGPLDRARLRERLDLAGIRTEGQALIHLLFLAAVRGIVVRGPVRGKQHAYVLVNDWLGEPPPVDRDAALAELARRYLAGHAPATARDLAKWAGLPLRDARAGLTAIASELVERDDGLLDLARRPATEAGDRELPRPRLLGAFEPVLLGWASRDDLVGERRDLVTVNGIIRAFLMVEGRAVGRWKLTGGKVALEPFAPLSAEIAAALDRDAADVVRYLVP